MEMEEITTETERNDEGDKGRSETQPEVKKEEEADTDIYSKLQSPSEDLYSEAQWLRRAPGIKAGNVLLWKRVCAVLAVIGVILLITVIFLVMKIQAEALRCKHQDSALEETIPGHRPSCACRQCKDGWVQSGQSCFFLSTLRESWDDGQKECQMKGGSLATIPSKTVQDFLTLKGDVTYWIGLRNNGGWTWINNSSLQEGYWSDTHGEGDCVILKGQGPNGKNWMTYPCHFLSYFICEAQLTKS